MAVGNWRSSSVRDHARFGLGRWVGTWVFCGRQWGRFCGRSRQVQVQVQSQEHGSIGSCIWDQACALSFSYAPLLCPSSSVPSRPLSAAQDRAFAKAGFPLINEFQMAPRNMVNQHTEIAAAAAATRVFHERQRKLRAVPATHPRPCHPVDPTRRPIHPVRASATGECRQAENPPGPGPPLRQPNRSFGRPGPKKIKLDLWCPHQREPRPETREPRPENTRKPQPNHLARAPTLDQTRPPIAITHPGWGRSQSPLTTHRQAPPNPT